MVKCDVVINVYVRTFKLAGTTPAVSSIRRVYVHRWRCIMSYSVMCVLKLLTNIVTYKDAQYIVNKNNVLIL